FQSQLLVHILHHLTLHLHQVVAHLVLHPVPVRYRCYHQAHLLQVQLH
ncbi:unnamed protein product, partial [Rotaria magnacalcarata]